MAESNGKMDIEELKQRALKITEALYRTTDIFFDGEPLKWSLRGTALEIMNIVSGLNASGQINEVNKLDKLVSNLFLKLELASSGTYISKMNFEVLEREYSMLNNGILEQSKTSILLDLPTSRQAIPSYRTQKQLSDIVSDRVSAQKPVAIEADQPKSESFSSVESKIEINKDRKSVIVSALKDGGPSSVSEVAKLFNGTIGEKTVQRELNSLVGVGAIKKEGEKRWRRYFI